MYERTQSIPRMYARITEVSVEKYKESSFSTRNDLLAVEEPLEIQISFSEQEKTVSRALSITMRTPGDDKAMTLGFLYAEGIISSLHDLSEIDEIATVGRDKPFAAALAVKLKPHVVFDYTSQERHFFSTSSCGVCGRLALDNLPAQKAMENNLRVDPAMIYRLPAKIRSGQTLFHHTGGIHAAALFDKKGQLLHLSEDVGRHNAMDKLIGSILFKGHTPPLSENVVLFSGRVSYELVQKAVVAGIPIIAAIGAPSSLAVEIAEAYGITLIGFLRDKRFNVYAGNERILRNRNSKITS